MKKILFISQYSPETLIVGDMVYTWDILQALKHHEDVYVHFLCYQDATRWYENETATLSALVDKVTTVPFRHLSKFQMALSLYPASVCNRASGPMAEAMQQILSEGDYDVVMLNTLRMAYLAPQVHSLGIRCVYLSHNVETEVSRSIYQTTTKMAEKIIYWMDYVKTSWWERHFLASFDAITTICSYDARYFRNNGFSGHVSVVRPIVRTTPFEQLKPHTGKLIICGSFTWLPKRLNLNHILDSPSIAHLTPADCRLQVVGRTLQAEIDKGNHLPGVHVTGPVDDVHPYYDDAEVAIVPELAGGGFKLKIAEAVRHHVPIVAIKGSITDDNMQPGTHYIEATTFDDLIDKAIALSKDRDLQHHLVENATRLFLDTYSLPSVSQAIMQVIV